MSSVYKSYAYESDYLSRPYDVLLSWHCRIYTHVMASPTRLRNYVVDMSSDEKWACYFATSCILPLANDATVSVTVVMC